MEDSVTPDGNVICDRGRITLYVADSYADNTRKKAGEFCRLFN